MSAPTLFEFCEMTQKSVKIPSDFGCIVAAKYAIPPKPSSDEPTARITVFISFYKSEDEEYLEFDDGEVSGVEYDALYEFSTETINSYIRNHCKDMRAFEDNYYQPDTDHYQYFFSKEEFVEAYPNVDIEE